MSLDRPCLDALPIVDGEFGIVAHNGEGLEGVDAGQVESQKAVLAAASILLKML